jgi:uncharacterized protein YndB with AHSA1/START domain
MLAVLALLADSGLRADVLNANAIGFTTEHAVGIAAPRMQVYEAFVNDIGRWWNPDHTVSGDAAHLSIDPRPQGCFCEALGDGAGLVHLTVTFVNPGVLLRMSGGLGPLGLMGVAGNMTVEIDEQDAHSRVTLQYAVGGYYADGLDKIAPAVDGVLIEQLERFRRFVETGDPQAER